MRTLLIAIALGPIAALQAQAPSRSETAPTAKSETTPTPKNATQESAFPSVAITTWSEESSRRLFNACDENADDALDVFEAGNALETIGTPPDIERFRHLDRDRDGFLSWSEFDQHFHDVVQHNGTFRVKPARALAAAPLAAEITAPAAPEEQLITLFDADHNGTLSATEMRNMLRAANVPTALQSQIGAFDKDQSSTFSAQEVKVVLPMAPQLSTLLNKKPEKSTVLPMPYDTMDRDGDGTLDADELAHALRQIDPQLARWAPAILAGADKNGDHRLSEAELQPALDKTQPARPLGSR